MNTKLNKIFKSFDDVKLESQEVELAMFKSIDEIKKMYNETKAVRDGISAIKSKVAQLVTALNVDGKSLNVKSSAFQTEIAKTIAEAKVLGLEVPADVKNLQNFAKDFPKVAQNAFKLANQMDAGIKTI
jgi:hypothetical protein